ncbi:MAG: 2-oxoacid:acceptor oxidoreductase subunit alpha [Candidatus Thermoplasmatota archaeon]|nr:2-oxoacid:acceptor oxidoreductase subunit alpha [Candidatus Thermoplasmatota archaeon]
MLEFINGDVACAEGAIAAGCRFFGGYPITPSTEIAERMALRLPQVGGAFMQMEDELASIMCVLGASWAGKKAMTATSGPGFSLMQESIGLAAMTETPCVIVDIQRAGPSTGLPTLIAQGDVMQSRFGSHGDYRTIVLAPSNAQEMYDLTIRAFNLSERFRTPVIVLSDEVCGHITSGVDLRENVDIESRKKPGSSEYLPFKADADLIPPMAVAGEGYRFHVTGLTHNEKGYPVTSAKVQQALVTRLVDKVEKRKGEIVDAEFFMLDDAEIGVIAYGSEAGSAKRAVKMAREKGIKAGLLRPKVLWPLGNFEDYVKDMKKVLVVELNSGQFYSDAKCWNRNTKLLGGHGGELHRPEDILKAMEVF